MKNTKKKTKIKTKINSLYIHIPFCEHICSYCDFTKFLNNEKYRKEYLVNLKKDLLEIGEKYEKFKTIYLGGGTPSILNVEETEELLSVIKPLLRSGGEFTIEANPETITEDKLKLYKKHKINRISIGIQSFNEKLLDEINRNYHINYFNLIQVVKKYFNNINVDLIFGLPNENSKDLLVDLENFIKLDIPHISIYSLTVNKGTMFFNKGIKEKDQDELRDSYDVILKTLRNAGYNRYEVSNFARPGYESKHNLNYWKNNEYVGVGVGASGYEGNIRYHNSANLTEYNKGIRNRDEEIESIEDKKEYFLLTNLRMEEGFKLSRYKKIFNEDFEIVRKNIINELINEKLIEIKKDHLRCTDNGLMLLDSILVKLFD